MVGHDRISILGFMLSDERKLGFPLAYACALDVMDCGEKLGGKVFSVGMYFTDRAKTFYGEERLKNIWNFKQFVDPEGIMNPGKIIPISMDKQSPTKMLSAAMKVANAGSGLIGLAGRLLMKWQGNDFDQSGRSRQRHTWRLFPAASAPRRQQDAPQVQAPSPFRSS